MKKFINKVVFFISPLIIIPLLIWPLDKLILKRNISEFTNNVIILGDSHSETGINDKLNVQLNNISQSSETYFFSYFKLKKIISVNKPSKIILGFSTHNLTFFQDEKTYALNGSDRYKDLYPRYFLSLDLNGFKQINKNSKGDFYSITNLILKENIKEILKIKNGYIGEYFDTTKSNLDTVLINKKIKIHFYDIDQKVRRVSHVQIEYLNKIINLCEEKDIDFYLLNLPVYHKYKKQTPKKFIKVYNDLVSKLKSNNVNFLDYSSVILPKKYFYDGDHLNSFGAEIITRKLILDLNLHNEKALTNNSLYKKYCTN
ncbi:hypothetical protein [Psychroflexus sediminis]|uniref:Uncharacterized protein n=1 Tax=Psychroflexus sediminis TaxID=470826 RepID=A0A1G7Z244_9FLAO|nr:hypothetical protein [Psychroflexus sediminis]SDH02714.1 hypothetical protein SAMN04488027_1175 [Psychroflexus sediminis]